MCVWWRVKKQLSFEKNLRMLDKLIMFNLFSVFNGLFVFYAYMFSRIKHIFPAQINTSCQTINCACIYLGKI